VSSKLSSLSRFRSNSSKKESEKVPAKKQKWEKYAPRNYKFGIPKQEYVQQLGAWEMSFGSDRLRGSVCSAVTGISPYASRRNSYEVPKAKHVEEVV